MSLHPPTMTMQRWVREAAEPAMPGESVKAAINRAARALHMPYARARAHWYGLARMVPAEEYLTARARRQAVLQQRIDAMQAETMRLLQEIEGAGAP